MNDAIFWDKYVFIFSVDVEQLSNGSQTEMVLPHSWTISLSFFSTSSTNAGKLESRRQRRSSCSRSPGGSVDWWYATGRDILLSPRKYWREWAWERSNLRGQMKRPQVPACHSVISHRSTWTQWQMISISTCFLWPWPPVVPEKAVWLTVIP